MLRILFIFLFLIRFGLRKNKIRIRENQFVMSRKYHVAIVGATGAVGVEMIKTLERRNFPVTRLTLLASARSAGKQLSFRGEAIPIKELGNDSFQGIDIALFSAGGGISREFAPLAARAGCVVID